MQLTTPPRGIPLPGWKIKVLPTASQFRVVVKRRDGEIPIDLHDSMFWFADGDAFEIKPPFQPGDVLFVKETWCCKMENGEFVYDENENQEYWYQAENPEVQAVDEDGFYRYRKDGSEASPWISASRMKEHQSRYHVRIQSVRCERLDAITEEDARAEGIEGFEEDGAWVYPCCLGPGTWNNTAKASFKELWDSASKHKFADNPFVWRCEFSLVKS